MTPTPMNRAASGSSRPHFDCARPLPLLVTKSDAMVWFNGSPEWAAHEADVLARLPKNLKDMEGVLQQRQQVADNSRVPADENHDGFKRPLHYIHMAIAPKHLNMLSIPGKRLCSYSLKMPDFEFLASFNNIPAADRENLDAYEAPSLPLKSSEFNVVVDAWNTISYRDNTNLSEAEARVVVRDHLQMPHLSQSTIKAIYDHWTTQRNMKGRPMIRHLVACNQDNGPFGVFRPRQKEKMNLRRQRRQHKDNSQKVHHVEQDLNKVLNILERMRVRDAMKLQLSKTKCIVYDQKRHQSIDAMFRSPLWPLAARLRQSRKRGALHQVSGSEEPTTTLPRGTASEAWTARVRQGRHNAIYVDRFPPISLEWLASGGAGWIPPKDQTAAVAAESTAHGESLLTASRTDCGFAVGAKGIPGCGMISAGSAPVVDTEPLFMYPSSRAPDVMSLLRSSAHFCALRPA